MHRTKPKNLCLVYYMENEFNRAERLTALRPQIPVIIEESAVSVAERFQNGG